MPPIPSPIPFVDPLPLPAPVWLFVLLLLLVFTLHVALMSSAVGGGLWALVGFLRGRGEGRANERRLTTEIAHALPVLVAFTVTLGVAALLFVQVLYGNFFYASSILIAVYWMAVIPLVIVAYYGFYCFAARAEGGSRTAGWTLVLALALLLMVGFIFVNNLTLMQVPARWLELYRAHPHGGALNLGEPLLVPRFLHVVCGAVLIFAAVVAHLGAIRLRREPEYGRWMVAVAARVLAVATGVQLILGVAQLLALPRAVLIAAVNLPLTLPLFALAFTAALAAVALVLLGSGAGRPVGFIHLGSGLVFFTLALMLGLRFLVRMAYLAPYSDLGALKVEPQWGVIGLFLVLFVGGLATLGFMVGLLIRHKGGAATAV